MQPYLANQLSPLDESLVTPSLLTNRLLSCCIDFQRRNIGWQIINQALEDSMRNATASRESFLSQIDSNGLRDVIPAPINMVLEAFKDFGQSLLFTRNSIQDPQNYPVNSAIMLIHDSYMELYDALLSYEWAYLGQGDEPHPALNLLQKSISAVHQKLMPDERFNDILDRLWSYFMAEQDDAERNIEDEELRRQRVEAIKQGLSGIEIMDNYFDSYDINYLLTGYERCHQGCLLIIQQIQETTGEALADAPTPSPQVNWVIHTAKAVIDGLNPELLIKAQAWFEPQLNESFFRFEQYATMATESDNTSQTVLQQIAIARDGYDQLNRALPLLRLGLDRRHLLVKAIRHLEDGAKLIHQAWEVLDRIEREGETVPCTHCGFANEPANKICSKCGAKLMLNMSVMSEKVQVPATIPVQTQPAGSSAAQSGQEEVPAHIARLLKAIESVRMGTIGLNDFIQNVEWGKQLLNTAIQSTSRLPESSTDNTVNNALISLRNGLQNFRDAIKAMEAYQRDCYPYHLDDASALLHQACQIFVALQQLTGKRR